MSTKVKPSPARLLDEAQNAAGTWAAAAARADDHHLAAEWGNLALAIIAAKRRAVELMSR